MTETSESFIRYVGTVLILYSSSDGGRGVTKRKTKAALGKERELRAQLKAMLAQPLMARGLSARYLTAGGSSQFAEAMLRGTNHKTMLGLAQTRAVDDVQ